MDGGTDAVPPVVFNEDVVINIGGRPMASSS